MLHSTPDSFLPPPRPASSVWSGLRRGWRRRRVERARHSQTTLPCPPAAERRVQAPDEVRAVFWQAFRHLFPAHAMAVQMQSGAILISWSMLGDPHAKASYAAPVMLRFEPDLIALMALCDGEQRMRIACHQESCLRSGLVGYDPYAAWPKARIVVLG